MGLSLAAWVGVAVALAALSLIVRTWNQIHTRAQCRRGHSMEDAIDRADGSRQCRTCYNAAARQRRLRVSAAVRAHTLTPPHGTTQAYNIHGCRCDKCREAKRLSRRPAEAAA